MKLSSTRTTGYALAGTAVAAVAVLCGAFLGAGAADASSGVRMTLVETGTAFHAVDTPMPAADGQAGDVVIFESSLAKNGKKVGRLEGHCLQIRADGSLDDCDVTVTIGKSSYRMSGPFGATGGRLTITGGTGDWVGAAGTDTIVNRPDGTSVHTVRITL